MTVATDITIVGAGPYGLSIAAHLRERGANFRIIGSPMQSWLRKMPKGMLLKSEPFSSTLYDPGSTFTLRRFCKDQGLPYQEVGLPVSAETFSSYGIAFQKHLVPEVEDTHLVALKRCSAGFDLSMADGMSFTTRKVVLATGLDSYRHIPEPLAHLPRELLTHSADHHDLEQFRGRDVVVIGGGSSAIDVAALLHEGQANVQVIARKPTISFLPMDMPARSLLQHIRAPMSGVGPGWKGLLWTDAPWLYRYLFDHFRIRTAKNFLGPPADGSWWNDSRRFPSCWASSCCEPRRSRAAWSCCWPTLTAIIGRYQPNM
ncbi:NAD(P)-binding domain-containing protein [Undibacterium arcticum]|uniref:NAD(P)-binding domain-containing protein n=1 Tax=Undibacterium arcticum TaxID=1762892 RepID=UPI00361111DC